MSGLTAQLPQMEKYVGLEMSECPILSNYYPV